MSAQSADAAELGSFGSNCFARFSYARTDRKDRVAVFDRVLKRYGCI